MTYTLTTPLYYVNDRPTREQFRDAQTLKLVSRLQNNGVLFARSR